MKKNKIINLCVICVMICFLLVCCSSNDSVASNDGSNRFVTVGDQYRIYGYKSSVVYDTKTENVYLVFTGYAGTAGGLSPIYNDNGEIMKIDEYYETR